ncbi:tetratricopeptide repeat protein [Actinoallomurus rhizosphaericola]|uniref:tetratricopeptide repeat protein n=1 Tax=Actinoallomurus rhizosphaericola TaxID=2952536 RepID=UPI00209375A6|nr:tetratricopeptide repeat protein [Actinoallomurus rhizosphaericola]MCO5994976.1 tetratricopeptide repeat protein [Actinoallomurus rhizosphaericola]
MAVPAVMTAAGVKDWRLLALGAATAAVAGVFAGPAQERFKSLITRRDEQSKALAAGSITTGGRALRVRDVTDPIRLGIHPAPALRRYGHGAASAMAERVPVYVPRDIDEEIRQTIARSGFVLLVGDSAAGKSRAAFEAIVAELPDHVLIAPTDRKALPAVLSEAALHRRCVLWLNDLERYLGAEGLTRTAVAGLLAGNNHRVIVATLRATEEARYRDAGELGDGDARQLQQDVHQVLDQAHRIHVGLSFTPAERIRAEDLATEDPRISDALTHADAYGIPEYLACGPQFLAEWENGWAKGTHPRGAALIAAAVDCRRAGYTDPLPRALLEEIHTHYLAEKGGTRLRPEAIEKAWEWATRVRDNGNALLQDTESGTVEVFDYLTDITQRHTPPGDHVPDHIVTATLTYASPVDARTIAGTAHAQGRYQLAEKASRQALTANTEQLGPDHPDTLTSQNNLALALSDLGRLEEAEAEHRAVLDARIRVLGPEHPNTLTSRGNLAVVLSELGRLEEAEAEHRAVLNARIRVLGPEHPDTLTSRNNLALVLSELGRLEEAEAEHRAELEACIRVLGPEHPNTLTSRGNLALVLSELGRLEEAEAEHRAVLDARIRVLGPEHPNTLASRNNLAAVLIRFKQKENG